MNNENFEKVAVLRRPLESGRQSPMNLSGIFVFGAFLQAGLYAAEYYIVGYSTDHPYKEEILRWHFWVSAVLIVLGLVLAIPFVYRRFEKLQYLISVLYSQNLFGVSFYICALFVATDRKFGASADSIMTFTWTTLLVGLFIFLLTSARFIWKIRKGDYREGSRSDQMRAQFEYKSYLPAATVAGLGIFFIIQYVIRQSGMEELGTLVFLLIGFGIFYTMLFVLPEQLAIFYYKLRYRSFNFEGRPYLVESVDEDEAEELFGDSHYR